MRTGVAAYSEGSRPDRTSIARVALELVCLGGFAMASLVYKTMAGRGRSVVAQRVLAAGSSLVECTPIAKVVKSAPAEVQYCQHCLGVAPHGMRHCSAACADDSAGLRFLERVDLSPLEAIHREQQRKFPLLVAQLLSKLLTGIQSAGAPPAAWENAMALCHANLEPEAMPQVEAEHAQLRDAFVAAGVASGGTLELLLPLARYAQLLGAAQLNAFELRMSHGFLVSCLLPCEASFFNHSCDPNALISVGETHAVSFVAAREIAAGEEVCISYVATDLPHGERQHIFQHKYGFECQCPVCRADAGHTYTP